MSFEERVNNKIKDFVGKVTEDADEATDNVDLPAEATKTDLNDLGRTADGQHVLRRSRGTRSSQLTRAAQRSVLTVLPAGGQRKARRNARRGIAEVGARRNAPVNRR